MTGWVILVDQPKDLPNADTPHKVITTSEYLARPRLFDIGRPKLVNLSRSYAYQSKGYYASLLAEARGHRVVPTVETMLELREAKLYEHALPELEDELNRCARRADFQPEAELKLLVCFGIARDPRFESFRPAPVRLVPLSGARGRLSSRAHGSRSSRIRPRNVTGSPMARPISSARRCTSTRKREWRDPKARTRGQIRSRGALRSRTRRCRRRHRIRSSTSARIAEKLSVDVEPITQPPTGRACRVRRPVHSRNHLDRQPYLSFRAPRLAGGHAGHRRSDLDDPLHEQGFPDGAAWARTRCRPRRP